LLKILSSIVQPFPAPDPSAIKALIGPLLRLAQVTSAACVLGTKVKEPIANNNPPRVFTYILLTKVSLL
jgi:hypothetical protein